MTRTWTWTWVGVALTLGYAKTLSAQTFREERPNFATLSFAKAMQGMTWKNRGANQIKSVGFDGSQLAALSDSGAIVARYPTEIIDEGILRTAFKDGSSAWYFFHEGLATFIAAKVASERTLSLRQDLVPQPLLQFPADLSDRVYVASPQTSQTPTSELRWNGTELEIAIFKEGEWVADRGVPILAHHRVFLFKTSGDQWIWVVFGSAGASATILWVDKVTGGNSPRFSGSAYFSRAETGLPEDLHDLHEFLWLMDEQKQTLTNQLLQRWMGLRLKNRPELLDKLKQLKPKT